MTTNSATDTAPEELSKRPPIVLLVAFVAVSLIAGVMYAPSLPAMAVRFGVSDLTIQLTMSVYLIAYAVAQLFVGTLSDWLGRRPVMLGGLALFTAASIVAALAADIELLIGARLLQALGASVGFVVSRAIVRDCFDTASSVRYLSYLGMASGLTPALSPMLGGVLEAWAGWEASFWFMAALAFVAVSAAGAFLGETHPSHRRIAPGIGTVAGGYLSLLKNPIFLGYSLTVAVATGIFFTFITGAPGFLIGRYNIPPDIYGFYAASMPAGFISGNFLSSLVSRRLGINRAIFLGLAISIPAGVAITLVALDGGFSTVGFVVPMYFFGISAGLLVPNAFAGAIGANPRLAGMASGLSGFLQMGAAALATTAVGALDRNSLMPYALMQLSLAVASALIFVALWSLNRRRSVAA